MPDVASLDLSSPALANQRGLRDEIEQTTGIKDDLMQGVFMVLGLIQVSLSGWQIADYVVADMLVGNGRIDFQSQGHLGTGCYRLYLFH